MSNAYDGKIETNRQVWYRGIPIKEESYFATPHVWGVKYVIHDRVPYHVEIESEPKFLELQRPMYFNSLGLAFEWIDKVVDGSDYSPPYTLTDRKASGANG